jgi:hypothetical protein
MRNYYNKDVLKDMILDVILRDKISKRYGAISFLVDNVRETIVYRISKSNINFLYYLFINKMSDINGDASDLTNIASSESNYSQIAKLDNESLISFKNDKLDFENFVNNEFSSEFINPIEKITPNKNSVILNKTYTELINFDDSGNQTKKIFSSQSINTHDNLGNNLSEIKSGYIDDEKGIKKSLEQKLLNNNGFKIVRTKDYINKEEREDKYLKGINENQIENFYKNYRNYKSNSNYCKHKYLK